MIISIHSGRPDTLRLIHDELPDFSDKVLQLLASVTETEEVFTNLDLPLYEFQVLDSMRTVQLMLMIEEEFGIKVSPAEFERETGKRRET